MALATGFRISDWDTPLRVNPNRSPGRFNGANSPATQYVGLHPLTPWAEYLRYHDLRRTEEIADRRLRVWALRLDLTDAVEIGFENAFEDFGLQPEDLVADDYTPCQRLADRFRADAAEPKKIIVPSAALPGSRNVVILGPRESIPYLWAPIDDGDIPACIVAEHSQPPEGLVDLVRFRGESHVELEEWLKGRLYDLADLG